MEPLKRETAALMDMAFRRRIRSLPAKLVPKPYGRPWSLEERAYLVARIGETIKARLAQGILTRWQAYQWARLAGRVANGGRVIPGWTKTVVHNLMLPCRCCERPALMSVYFYGYCRKHEVEAEEHRQVLTVHIALAYGMTTERGSTPYGIADRGKDNLRKNSVAGRRNRNR